MNRMVQESTDTNNEFTRRVTDVANQISQAKYAGTRDSLDFKYQKEKAELKFQKVTNPDDMKVNQYIDSKKLEKLKDTYTNKNAMPTETVAKRLTTKSDYLELKDSAVEKLGKYRDYHDIRTIVSKDNELGDTFAENSFDSIVRFNEDMRILALNGLQLKQLMEMVQEENNNMYKLLYL